MICYLDSSALTKRYVLEAGSEEVRLLVTEAQVVGYDAVQLAAAAIWQDNLEAPVTLLTFDRQLWAAARHEGMIVRPEAL